MERREPGILYILRFLLLLLLLHYIHPALSFLALFRPAQLPLLTGDILVDQQSPGRPPSTVAIDLFLFFIFLRVRILPISLFFQQHSYSALAFPSSLFALNQPVCIYISPAPLLSSIYIYMYTWYGRLQRLYTKAPLFLQGINLIIRMWHMPSIV